MFRIERAEDVKVVPGAWLLVVGGDIHCRQSPRSSYSLKQLCQSYAFSICPNLYPGNLSNLYIICHQPILPSASMFLINLPPELIILSSDFLEPRDFYALGQTASSFANLLGLHLLDRGLTDPKLEILLWAAARGDEAIISKVLERAGRKRINIPPHIKDSMLMTAVLHNRVDLLEYLVRTVGANLSAMVPHEYSLLPRTALHEAAEQGNTVTTQNLIELGADVNAIDTGGLSPLHYAVWKPDREDASAGEAWDTDEELEYGANSIAILRLLLEHGAQTEAVELDRRQTPLLWASIDGNTEAISLLLDHGANINASDDEGCTALHLAAEYGNHEAVQLLVDKRADIFAIDYNADTPLDLAASVSVREILRKAGALTSSELGRELERFLSERRTNDEV
jgi:ankyrin repeat protein